MAIYYIDPSAAGNGSGTVESPYNTWVGVTLTANNTYRQKRGTTYTGASVRPQSQTSSASTPLTIEAYYHSDGSDDTSKPKPIIDHNGGTNGVGAVFVDTCNYVVVRNIVGQNSDGALGGGVVVRRSNNWQILNCVGRNSEHGICITQDQGSGTSTCADGVIDGCELYSNVSGGITFRWGAASTAVIKRVQVKNNLVYWNGTGKGTGAGAVSVPCGGIVSYTVYKADTSVNYRNEDFTVYNNKIFENNGYGLNVEMLSSNTLVSRIYQNDIYGNGSSGDVDSHSLWVGNCFGVLIDSNFVHDNSAYVNAASGSGVGIYVDYNGTSATGGAYNVVRGNTVARQFSGLSQAVPASSGIHVLLNTGTVVEGNVIVGCRNGVSVGPSGTDGTIVQNNTVIDSTQYGVCVQASTNTTVRNNIIDTASVGLFAATAGVSGYSESYNNVYNCTTPAANGTISVPTSTPLAGTDSTVDPLLTDRYEPLAASLLAAGTPVVGLDYNGKEFKSPPNIGAVQTWSTRAIANRSQRLGVALATS